MMTIKTKAELQAENTALIEACQPLVDLWQQYRDSGTPRTFAGWIDGYDARGAILDLVIDEIEDLLADIDSAIFHVRREQSS